MDPIPWTATAAEFVQVGTESAENRKGSILAASRQILERIDQNAATVEDVARTLREQGEVRVLDQGVSNLLVEGKPDELEKIGAGLPGWQAVPLRRIPVPDTRPRVLRPPED
jgi:hypothetical protein